MAADSSPSAFLQVVSFFLLVSALLFFGKAKPSPGAIVSFVHTNKKHKKPRIVLTSRFGELPD